MYDCNPLNRNQKQNPKSISGEELLPSHCKTTGPSLAKNFTDERQDKLIFRYESVQSAGPSFGRKMESGLMLYNERCDILRAAFDSEIIKEDINSSSAQPQQNNHHISCDNTNMIIDTFNSVVNEKAEEKIPDYIVDKKDISNGLSSFLNASPRNCSSLSGSTENSSLLNESAENPSLLNESTKIQSSLSAFTEKQSFQSTLTENPSLLNESTESLSDLNPSTKISSSSIELTESPSDLNASTIISSSSLEPTKSPSLPRELTEIPLFPRGSTEGPFLLSGPTESPFVLKLSKEEPSFQNIQPKVNVIEGNLLCIGA
ncbi:hypothetical protein TNIN_267501 [Trichonephila inaurata madagascariensis]|uniref:Uncharacterized protein n=1 Tax=Trichonephila inaurata madagascariensis TaxID=2747483 RepID=A0A8X6XKF6_9ARAC|nr:hypothetical protein TNIN_267501 [Trichonephila inaurata madagascariensis]